MATGLVSASCGADPTAPPPVAVPSPFVAQVGGQYAGSATLVSVAGILGSNTGCVGGDVLGRITAGVLPAEDVSMTVTQDSNTVAARLTSSGSGLSCSYSGSTALNAVVLDATGTACNAPTLIFRCVDSGVREMGLVGSSVVGSVTGGAITGTVTNTYNVTESGSPDVGLILRYSYNLNRQ